MNRLFKYTMLVSIFFTCGILFFLVGRIGVEILRYKVYDIFQFGSDQIFKLADWKFNTSKDNTLLVSYGFISPIVNLLSSVIWTSVILGAARMLKLNTENYRSQVSIFWKRAFYSNVVLSTLFLLIWLLFITTNTIYSGVYSSTKTILPGISWFVWSIINIPSLVPVFISTITLDQGGDTLHGYLDMYLIAKTISSFSVTIWSLIFGFVFTFYRNKRKLISDDSIKSPIHAGG